MASRIKMITIRMPTMVKSFLQRIALTFSATYSPWRRPFGRVHFHLSHAMLFEFQHQKADGDWISLGIAQAEGERFDLNEAVVELRRSRGGLPQGRYRVRAIELILRWRFCEIDEHNVFRQTDE